jgi:hypothetical protein
MSLAPPLDPRADDLDVVLKGSGRLSTITLEDFVELGRPIIALGSRKERPAAMMRKKQAPVEQTTKHVTDVRSCAVNDAVGVIAVRGEISLDEKGFIERKLCRS